MSVSSNPSPIQWLSSSHIQIDAGQECPSTLCRFTENEESIEMKICKKEADGLPFQVNIFVKYITKDSGTWKMAINNSWYCFANGESGITCESLDSLFLHKYMVKFTAENKDGNVYSCNLILEKPSAP